MRNVKLTSLILIQICATTIPVLSSTGEQQQVKPNLPTVAELLNKYTQALDSTQSFIASYEVVEQYSYYVPNTSRPLPKMEGAKRYNRTYHRSDGRRIYEQLYDWGDLSARDVNLPEKNANYICRIISDKFDYQNTRILNNTNLKGGASYSLEGTEKATLSLNSSDSYILGYIGSYERLDVVLRESKQISLGPKTERINNSDCYVIDAQTKYGKYSLWLDPEHGYHPVKINYKAVEGDEYYDKGKLEKGNSRTGYLDNVRFEKVDDVWVPMEADRGSNNIYGDTESFTKDDTHFKRTQIILNPDHDALDSFDDPLENPEQDPELINGTRMHFGTPIQYIWQDGKVVNSYGHEVDPKNLKSSIIGKALPDLAPFNINLNPEQAKNKMLLICFWDINQRPSRNAIQTLNKKAASLTDNGLYMVFIHAGPVAKQTLVPWLNQNEIKLPAGISNNGLPELGYTWGVQSLPWFILTDKNHVVVAEGFALNELNDKISEAENEEN